MAKTTFIKFMGSSHLNYLNIEAREHFDGSVDLWPVHVARRSKLNPPKRFPSMEAAQDWYDGLPGNALGRLDNALDVLLGRD